MTANASPHPGQLGFGASNPSVSVVMSVYNSSATLDAQLAALANQTYKGEWELIIADNGSTDDSWSVAGAWADRIPGLRVVDASERQGDPPARNAGCRHAMAPNLAFCDSDDVVDSDWLNTILSALRQCDVAAGACPFFEADTPFTGPLGERRANPYDGGYDYLPFGLGANLAMSTDTFRAIGGFREDYQAAADVDLCWRAQLAGYTFRYEPAAIVHKRRRGSLSAAWKRHFIYGQDDPILFHNFRHQGMPRHFKRSLRTYAWLLTATLRLFDPDIRATWARACGKTCGRVVGSSRRRTLYL